MFASILDRYPDRPVGPADEPARAHDRLEERLRDQFEAGMGMLGDGLVHDVSGSADAIDRAVAAWNEAAEVAAGLAVAESPQLEPPLVKACVVGPWSVLAGGPAAHGPAGRPAGRGDAHELARRIRDGVDALFEAGAAVVQLTEDALVHLDPGDASSMGQARELLELATRSPRGHLSLSVGGGAIDRLGPGFVFALPVASVALDLINGPDNWRVIAAAPADRGILCGVADCRTDQPDEPEVLIYAARYAAATAGRGLERVALCPSAGLEDLPRPVARAKLDGLARATRLAGLPPEELARSIDPRAIDARSAALGRFAPTERTSR